MINPKKALVALALSICTLSAPLQSVTAEAKTSAVTSGSTSYTFTYPDIYDEIFKTASASRSEYHEYFSHDKPLENMQLSLKNSRDLFPVTNYKTWYFYHFGNSGITGIGADGSQFHLNGYGTLSANIKDNRYLTVDFRSIRKDLVCKDLNITFDTDDLKPKYSTSGTHLTADLYDDSFRNGFYEIDAAYMMNGKTDHCRLYLFVNCASDATSDCEFRICYGEAHYKSESFKPVTRQKEIAALLSDEHVTVSDALENGYIYPYNGTSDLNDSAFWINKAHTILDGYKNLTKAEQALLLHDWITANLKYDNYKVNVIKYSRYSLNGLDPNQFVSKNYTGVCLDFSCIYTIMCREFDIPCVVLSNDSHAWNAVYLNDEWIEIDLTIDVNRYVNGKDTNVVTGDQLYCYDSYATYDDASGTPKTAARFLL